LNFAIFDQLTSSILVLGIEHQRSMAIKISNFP
jgi:hypothetical protein